MYFYAWKNIKSEYNNYKFKVYAPTWDETFHLRDDSYYITDIQDHFEFMIKKHETLTEDPPVQIYPNKVKKTIYFQNKNLV